MALTKDDIVKALADENGYPLNQSVELIETLLELIKSALGSGEDVLISGFGKFCVKAKRERKGRNPATGEDLMLKARKVVTFKCSGQLRKRINYQEHSRWTQLDLGPPLSHERQIECSCSNTAKQRLITKKP